MDLLTNDDSGIPSPGELPTTNSLNNRLHHAPVKNVLNRHQTLTITGSTFSNNTTGNFGGGGALFNTSTATITNSTFSGNSATGVGGAIITTNNLSITNSTISGNSALATGGLDVEGNVTHLRNTIIANDSSSTIDSTSNNDYVDNSDYPNPPSPDGDGIMTNINNLIEDGSCSAGRSRLPDWRPKPGRAGR